MAVKYVSDFSFPKSPARPTVVQGQRPVVRGYAKGGHVKASTPQPYAKGGSCTTPFKYKTGGSVSPDIAKGVAGKSPAYSKLNDRADPKGTRKDVKSKVIKPAFKDGGSIKVATGKVADGKKTPWNADDAVSPGSPKRTPPGQGEKNASAAKSTFAHDGRGTEPATEQKGDVQRMSGWSDFKKGGSTKPAYDRLKNLGHYAHGGKVKASSGEKKSGSAGSGKVKAPVAKVSTPKKAEPTKAPAGSRVEMKSGTAKAAMGGLSRGTSPKKNAAIHAKSSHKAPSSGALAGLAQALSAPPSQPSAPGIGPAPPGMQPQMGSPPGQALGPRMAPPMAHGGVVHNHFWGK